MLSKSGARNFFLLGTALCFLAFILLTVDTIAQVQTRTNAADLTPTVVRGKHLWESSNCMGCHTLLGEGAYYAPELTKVYQRRGPLFIRMMLKDPESMYPGQRKMVQYDFDEQQIEDLIAFFEWIGRIDTNGFPAEPDLMMVAAPNSGGEMVDISNRPQVFNTLCVACHSMDGQGGAVGPALDLVGDRYDRDYLLRWIADPQSVKPGTAMPDLGLNEEQITELATFLSQKKKEANQR